MVGYGVWVDDGDGDTPSCLIFPRIRWIFSLN